MTLTKASPFTRNHLIRDAISRAIYDSMKVDDSIYLFGEGCEAKQFYDAPYILEEFPSHVTTLPISEDGNVNACVGASLLGIKPVYDLIGADFLFRTMDSLSNTAAKLDFVTGQGHTIVIRAEFLTGGPTTGQRPEAMFAHVPGLRIAIPSTPHDAYGLMRTALSSPGVTLFFEDRMIRDDGHFTEADLHIGESIPFGKASLRSYGVRGAPLVVTYGLMRQVVEDCLPSWSEVKLLDLRTVYPIDWDVLRYSMSRHNKVLIVEPDITYGGVGAEIAATLAQEFVGVQIKRLGAPHTTVPASPALHHQMLPSKEAILGAITADW